METITIVAFQLGEEEYGLDIANVESIERVGNMTRIPNAPEEVKGVMNLRGNIMPVIDLKKKLGLGETSYTEETRIVITHYDDIHLGLIVDFANDVIDVNPKEMESPATESLDSEFFGGVLQYDSRLIVMLKLKELIQRGKEEKNERK